MYLVFAMCLPHLRVRMGIPTKEAGMTTAHFRLGVSSVKETVAQAVDTIAVWGLYLLFYTVIFGALILGAYAMAQQIVLGG